MPHSPTTLVAHTDTPQASLGALVGAALVVLLVAQTGDTAAPGQGASTLLLPAHGVALALLLCCGIAVLPGVAAGWLLAFALAGDAPLHALAHTTGNVVALLIAARWLRAHAPSAPDRPYFRALQHLLLGACVLGAGAGALCASALHWLLLGEQSAGFAFHLAQTWMGGALGFVLLTPLVLVYRLALRFPQPQSRLREGVLVWLLTALAGGIIFGAAAPAWLAPLANAYWLFLFVGWAGVRLGLLASPGLLCLIALQALWGAYQGSGYFGRDIASTWGFGYWSYCMILAVLGLALSSYMDELQRQRTALRIAATAFDSQEGLLITDAQGRILQVNPALLRLCGLDPAALLGGTPQRLFADAPGVGPERAQQAGAAWYTPAANAQHRLRIVRADASTAPAWVSISAVRDSRAVISHYVLSITDVTEHEAQQQRRREAEAAQRNALIREVHHRIKNNLQGIIGMLRTLAQQHPRLHQAIGHTIGQVHGIATVHGLQAQNAKEAVALTELLCAIAAGVAQTWNTQLSPDIDCRNATPLLAHDEAVAIALVLHELLVNAVKHGAGNARLALRCDASSARISVTNAGHWNPSAAQALPAGQGLDLARLLLPRRGATLSHHSVQQNDGQTVVAELVLTAEVLSFARDSF